VIIAATLAAGCSESGHDDDWGHEALLRFDLLAAALDRDDIYGILDFYSASSTVQSRTSDFQNAQVPVSDYLASHRADLSQDPLAVHLGASGAVVLVAWPEANRLGAIATMMDDNGAIAREVVFIDIASLDRGLLASPDVVERYTDLYRSYAAAWSSTGKAARAPMYAPDATIRNALNGFEARGGEANASPLRPADGVQDMSLESLGHDGASSADPALYLDPVSFGEDPHRAIGVYRFLVDGCTIQTAVTWQLDDAGRITGETRYPEVESVRACDRHKGPEGWWTGLGPPISRDEIVTGVLETPQGQTIEVFNGTGRLMDLIEWSFDRFAAVGMAEPRLDSVTFEPTRRCEGVGGRVTAGDDAHDLVLCIDEPDLCGQPESCSVPLLAIRSAMLHEMGHAWLHDNTDAASRNQLLEVSRRSVWSSSDIPWVERGVEYAAEIIAWGLIDERIELEQLGSPPCGELLEAFGVLTKRPPASGASVCTPAG
jgi:hypothetical protein